LDRLDFLLSLLLYLAEQEFEQKFLGLILDRCLKNDLEHCSHIILIDLPVNRCIQILEQK
jgi:hypothetical protein